MTDFITQIEPWIDEAELTELKRVIDSTFVVEHKLTKEFEQMTCDLSGSKYAVAMTNGTVALFCCLKALGIGRGDEVIVPNITFIASANAVLMCGATPVLCEVDPNTFCMTVDTVQSCMSENTKAIMPVHLYGQSADIISLVEFAKRNNIKVVEDAAQAVNSRYNNKYAGSLADLGTFSFHATKNYSCGDV